MYYEQAWNTLLDTFIDDPYTFYGALMIRVQERRLSSFEPALFTVPCSRCGKPVLFTHRDSDWASEEKRFY